jgi:diamine N-acetyltransferase
MKRAIQPFGTGLVQLRLIAEADLDMTMSWRNHDEVRIWFKNSQIITREQHRAWYSQYLTRDDDFVFLVEAQGRPVGHASVYAIDWVEAIGEIGRFMVAPEAGGRGYIGLACGELLQFCAENLRLRSVFLEVKENNFRAIKIYERNGFLEEGRAAGIIRMSRSLNRDLARSAYAGHGSIASR